MSEFAAGRPHSPRFLQALGPSSGFRSDARFRPGEAPPPARQPVSGTGPEDPLATAWLEGHAAGRAEAEREAFERAAAEARERETLALSFARLDRDMEEQLRLRLRDTVAALCESAIAPLALDEAGLLRRIETAVSMLSRADDERTIRLHPDDMALVCDRFRTEWRVVADATLERGGLRVESANGGVEDGPAIWRRAIAEALRQC